MKPETACYEAPFSRKSTGCGEAHIVYTEDVGGSSPSSPTSFPRLSEDFTKCSAGSLNRKAALPSSGGDPDTRERITEVYADLRMAS